MARGAQSKEKITDTILKTFPNSFIYEREIRIPIMEDGELIQIKVTLTAAKTNVEQGDEHKLPGVNSVESAEYNFENSTIAKDKVTLTEEEKNNVATLLKNLGL